VSSSQFSRLLSWSIIPANARSLKVKFYPRESRRRDTQKLYLWQMGVRLPHALVSPNSKGPLPSQDKSQSTRFIVLYHFKRATIWKWRVHLLEVTEKECCSVFQ